MFVSTDPRGSVSLSFYFKRPTSTTASESRRDFHREDAVPVGGPSSVGPSVPRRPTPPETETARSRCRLVVRTTLCLLGPGPRSPSWDIWMRPLPPTGLLPIGGVVQGGGPRWDSRDRRLPRPGGLKDYPSYSSFIHRTRHCPQKRRSSFGGSTEGSESYGVWVTGVPPKTCLHGHRVWSSTRLRGVGPFYE